MTAKQALRERIDAMSEEEAEDLLDFLNLQDEPDTLTDEELERTRRIREEMARGEYITIEELKAKYDL